MDQHQPIGALVMSALPKEVNLDPRGVSAWNLLLVAEDAALKNLEAYTFVKPANYQDKFVGVRILGFFLFNFYKHSNFHQINLIQYNHLVKKFYRFHRIR
jgi:hypothetical protein